MEVYNAYRRNPPRLPPPIAAAKLTRLAQLLPTLPPWPPAASSSSPSARAAPPAQQGPAQQDTAAAPEPGSATPPAPVPAPVRGVGRTLLETLEAWDTFLHLFSAADLAACVRASAEIGPLRLGSRRLAGASAEASAESGAAAAAPGKAVGAAAAAAGVSGAQRTDLEPLRQSLVRRSVAVLLGGNGRELAEAGPQAIVDLSYGLMLASHDDAATWQTLGRLLREAQPKLTSTPAPGEAGGQAADKAAEAARLAGEVLQWLDKKGQS